MADTRTLVVVQALAIVAFLVTVVVVRLRDPSSRLLGPWVASAAAMAVGFLAAAVPASGEEAQRLSTAVVNAVAGLGVFLLVASVRASCSRPARVSWLIAAWAVAVACGTVVTLVLPSLVARVAISSGSLALLFAYIGVVLWRRPTDPVVFIARGTAVVTWGLAAIHGLRVASVVAADLPPETITYAGPIAAAQALSVVLVTMLTVYVTAAASQARQEALAADLDAAQETRRRLEEATFEDRETGLLARARLLGLLDSGVPSEARAIVAVAVAGAGPQTASALRQAAAAVVALIPRDQQLVDGPGRYAVDVLLVPLARPLSGRADSIDAAVRRRVAEGLPELPQDAAVRTVWMSRLDGETGSLLAARAAQAARQALRPSASTGHSR